MYTYTLSQVLWGVFGRVYALGNPGTKTGSFGNTRVCTQVQHLVVLVILGYVRGYPRTAYPFKTPLVVYKRVWLRAPQNFGRRFATRFKRPPRTFEVQGHRFAVEFSTPEHMSYRSLSIESIPEHRILDS